MLSHAIGRSQAGTCYGNFFLLQAQTTHLFLHTCVLPHTPTDGKAMIYFFLNSYAVTGNRTHVSSAAPVLRHLNSGCLTGWALFWKVADCLHFNLKEFCTPQKCPERNTCYGNLYTAFLHFVQPLALFLLRVRYICLIVVMNEQMLLCVVFNGDFIH